MFIWLKCLEEVDLVKSEAQREIIREDRFGEINFSSVLQVVLWNQLIVHVVMNAKKIFG